MEVRQSAFAVVGELAKSCTSHLKQALPQVRQSQQPTVVVVVGVGAAAAAAAISVPFCKGFCSCCESSKGVSLSAVETHNASKGYLLCVFFCFFCYCL